MFRCDTGWGQGCWVGFQEKCSNGFSEVGGWVEPVDFSSLNEGVGDSGGGTAFGAAYKEPFFSSDGNGAQGVLCWIIVDGCNTAVDKSAECEPLVEGVGGGFGQGFGGAAGNLPGVEFFFQCSQNGFAALVSLRATFSARRRGDLAFR